MPFWLSRPVHLRDRTFPRAPSSACRWKKSAVLRQFVGGSGLGVKLGTLDAAGAAIVDRSQPEASSRFACQSLVGEPADNVGEVRGGEQRAPRRGASMIRWPAAASAGTRAAELVQRAIMIVFSQAPELSVVVIDETGVRLEPAIPISWRHVPGDWKRD